MSKELNQIKTTSDLPAFYRSTIMLETYLCLSCGIVSIGIFPVDWRIYWCTQVKSKARKGFSFFFSFSEERSKNKNVNNSSCNNSRTTFSCTFCTAMFVYPLSHKFVSIWLIMIVYLFEVRIFVLACFPVASFH